MKERKVKKDKTGLLLFIRVAGNSWERPLIQKEVDDTARLVSKALKRLGIIGYAVVSPVISKVDCFSVKLGKRR